MAIACTGIPCWFGGSVVSDALIALSSFVIPAALIRIVHRRSDMRFGRLFSAAQKSPLGGARFVVALNRSCASCPTGRPSQLAPTGASRPNAFSAP